MSYPTEENEQLHAKIAELEEEQDHNHRLISRQGRLLTGVVNAIRGEPDELSLHSHHDAPELARKAMAVVHAARPVLAEADRNTDNFNRLREALAAMPKPEIVCEDCGGEGEVMVMECYGGPPCEVKKRCEPCKGEGFIKSNLPLTDPGVPLPGWEAVACKSERGEALNPIEALVMRLTPGDDDRAKDFRRMLRAALDYTVQQTKAVAS